MKKFLIIVPMLLILISCGKGKDKDSKSKFFDNLNQGEIKKEVNEVEKYNVYIGIYNDLLSFEDDINDYFEDAGDKEQFQKPSGSVDASFSNLTSLIKKMKEAVSAKPAMAELDKSVAALTPIIEEASPLTQDMKGYYDGKDYTSDNYKKAQEFHTKLLAIVKKYNEAIVPFRAAMDKKVAEQREKEMKMLQKEGRKISYNKMVILSVSEEILAEIKKQKLNGANFTTGDVSKFKPLQEKLINAVSEFQNSVNDEAQLKKEGYASHTLSGFLREATEFKATTATFIERIENKKKVDDFKLSNSFFLETENGTPENVIRSFNELVRAYNSSNR